jgi:hypothetical protein
MGEITAYFEGDFKALTYSSPQPCNYSKVAGMVCHRRMNALANQSIILVYNYHLVKQRIK